MTGNPQRAYDDAMRLAQTYGTAEVSELMAAGATSQTAAENTLEPGKVYAGRVEYVNLGTRIMTVSVGQQRIANCVYAAGEMASFFGLEERSMPMIGASVSLLYMGAGTTSIVLGSTGSLHIIPETGRPSIVGNQQESPGKEKAWSPENEAASQVTVKKGAVPPIDVLPGESMRTSGLGPTINLLYNFAQLSASECAKVEACVLNDMVRIVDNYFVHHTCGGDTLTWTSGGKCTEETHFTGTLYEAEGKLSESEPLAEGSVAEFNYDTPKSVENLYSDTGRWRFSQYKGFLGDMVHRWVTTPTEVISNIMDNALRAGQYRSWIGSDGTLCVQAAGGVQIEVTQHIVIPAILKAWNQPDFDMAKAMEDLNDEFLKVWGSGPDWKDLTVAVWQLRYYSKYLTLWHSLARFRQLAEKGYCEVPIEDKVPERKPAAGEEDREQACPEADFVMEQRKGHAILSMDPGGGVALVSQGSTAIVLSNGSMQLSCPGNLELKAGGTVSIQGKDVSVRGADTVEVLSLFGSLTLKARTLWQALCEAGVLWLKGDASKDKDAGESPLGDSPEAVFREYAVVIDAPEGKTLVHGADGVTVGSTEPEANITLQTLGKDSNVNLLSKKDINILAKTGTIFSQCKTMISQAVDLGLYGTQLIKLGTQVVIKKGVLHAMLIYTQLAAAYGTFLGRSQYVSKKDDMEPYKPDTKTEELDALRSDADAAAAELASADFQQEEFTTDAVFKLATWDGKFSSDIEEQSSLKRSFYEELAEQESKDFVTVELEDAKLLKGKRTEQSVPFPGREAQRFEFTADLDGKLLGDAWTTEFSSSDIKTANDMVPKPYTYVFTKK